MAQGDEQDKRIPLVVMPENRDTTTAKDARLVNCYMEAGAGKGQVNIYKRAGISLDYNPSGGAATGEGCYNWKGDVYSVFGTVLYKNSSVVGTVDGTGGVYSFNQALGTPPVLVLGNGVAAYNYDGTTLTQITAGTNATGTSCSIAVTTGILTVTWASGTITTGQIITGTGVPFNTIVGTNLTGVGTSGTSTWNALNTLTAQIEPDGGVALSKQLVYVIALKQWTTEVFYDAANPTGSPLATVQGAKVNYGCVHSQSVQDIDGKLFWLGNNRNSNPQVLMMDKLSAEVISTKSIDRLLTNINTSSLIYSFSFKDSGHQFYVLTLKDPGNITLAYDVAEKMWSQWTDVNGNYLPIVACTFDSTGERLWQHESNGNMYIASKDNLNDVGSIITADIYTPNFDGGTSKKKYLNRLFFVGDQVTGSQLQVRVSDDDYQTWTNFRTVDLGIKRPYLDRCGSFYKRAFHLRHANNTVFRLSAMEHQIELGTL